MTYAAFVSQARVCTFAARSTKSTLKRHSLSPRYGDDRGVELEHFLLTTVDLEEGEESRAVWKRGKVGVFVAEGSARRQLCLSKNLNWRSQMHQN